jgi:hypothetical protein
VRFNKQVPLHNVEFNVFDKIVIFYYKKNEYKKGRGKNQCANFLMNFVHMFSNFIHEDFIYCLRVFTVLVFIYVKFSSHYSHEFKIRVLS